MKPISKILTGMTALSVTVLGFVSPALAETAIITANGSSLSSAILASGNFTSVVNAPAGTKEVKFILDGKYLGQDTTAPFSWNVSTTEGTHALKIRTEGTTAITGTSNFTVKTGTSTSPIPTPTLVTTSPAPVTSTGTVISVNTVAQLQNALRTAQPGSTVKVADGTYKGVFAASANGQSGKPITLIGTSKVILTTGSVSSGYGLHITGDYWNVKGISVTTSSKGIVLDGSVGTILDSVDVGNTGTEAVHFRKNSSNGQIINSKVHDAGKTTAAYGEGVYIGTAKSNWSSIMGSSSTPDASNNVTVKNNHIYNTTAEGIDIKEGTSGGFVTGNTFTNAGYSGANYGDSWVDVKGNGYTISGNTGAGTKLDAFQVHKALDGWGNNNKFSNNTVTAGVPGYLVSVQSGVTGTTVACQATLAKQGISNIACS